jgi:Methyltransferase domain
MLSDVHAKIDQLLPGLPGWCTPEKGRRMAAIVVEVSGSSLRPALCVELGVFGGRSMLAMSLACQGLRRGRVEGIDPYTAAAALEGRNDKANDEWWAKISYEDILRQARAAIENNGLAPYAKIIRATSADAVGAYADGSIDVLHQDSNHSEEITCAEVRAWTPKIRPGGFWIADDTNWATTQKAYAALANDYGFVRREAYESWAVYRKGGGDAL